LGDGELNLLHKLGLHSWRHAFGDFNRYYECKVCGARKVVRGLGGYQPIADWWLAGADQPPPLVPPQGGSGVPARTPLRAGR
jgi:hypothetical protein